MVTNQAGINLIKRFEGCSLTSYICPAGVRTIGFGSVLDLDGNPLDVDYGPVTDAEAEKLLVRGLHEAEYYTARLVDAPLETHNQFAALVSICYNIGSRSFQRAVFRMHLNRGDYQGCADNFWQWRRGGRPSKILPGLVRRREAERQLFMTPDASPADILADWLGDKIHQ